MQDQQHSSNEPSTQIPEDYLSTPRKPMPRKPTQKKRFRVGAFAGIFGMSIGAAVVAVSIFGGPRATAVERTGNGPAVIELFTSQGCYSCPPAEKLLGELVKSNPELVALEFHVDYWDKLVYGSHGSHKDPFSDEDNTLRQRTYNQASLQGRTGVYTPQMVINGQYAAVGSSASLIKEGIEVLDRPVVDLDVTHNPTIETGAGKTGLNIELGDYSRAPTNTHLWIAIFDIEKTTVITTGENHDKTLVSHNVVREFNQLTPNSGLAELVSADNGSVLNHQVELKAGQGCAVLLQDESLGTIYGAAYCPKSLWKKTG